MSNRRGEKVLNFGAISRLAEYRSILSSCFHSMKERPLLFNHYYKIEEKCLNWSGHIMWILLIHRHLSECKICQIMSSWNGWGRCELVLTFLFWLASFWCNIWHLCSCQIKDHTAEIINTDGNIFSAPIRFRPVVLHLQLTQPNHLMRQNRPMQIHSTYTSWMPHLPTLRKTDLLSLVRSGEKC